MVMEFKDLKKPAKSYGLPSGLSLVVAFVTMQVTQDSLKERITKLEKADSSITKIQVSQHAIIERYDEKFINITKDVKDNEDDIDTLNTRREADMKEILKAIREIP